MRRNGSLTVVVVERIGDFPGTDLAVDVEEVFAVLRSRVNDD